MERFPNKFQQNCIMPKVDKKQKLPNNEWQMIMALERSKGLYFFIFL